MFEFLVIVMAILVAQVVGMVVVFAAACNTKAAKWYAKKMFKMSKVVEKEMLEMFEKDEL